MKNSKSLAIVAGSAILFALWLFPPGAEPSEPAPAKNKADRLAAALTSLRATAQQLVQLRIEEYRSGKSEYSQLLSTQRHVLSLETELAPTKADRQRLLANQLELAKRTEQLVRGKYEAGLGTQGDVLESRLFRLKIEVSLLGEQK